MRGEGAGPKTIVNALTLLHQIFAFGERRGWCESNPCKQVDRPVVEQTTDIRFLTLAELEALLRAESDGDPFGPIDRVLYLTAAMTGLRQGELLGLRWRDVDWAAARIRVRQNYVRGHWGTPKSRRGSRSVPMADRIAAELERHFQRSAFQGDDDLVFAHPHTGSVLDHSDLAHRYKNRFAEDVFARSVSTTYATRSEPGWRPPEFRYARCRNGWAIATSRRR
jgi:integrase